MNADCFASASHAATQSSKTRWSWVAHHWKHLELRGKIFDDWQPTPWASYVGHEVNLGGGAEAVFDRFNGGVRQAIRKAEKAQVETRALNALEATRTFYSLHCRTRRK